MVRCGPLRSGAVNSHAPLRDNVQPVGLLGAMLNAYRQPVIEHYASLAAFHLYYFLWYNVILFYFENKYDDDDDAYVCVCIMLIYRNIIQWQFYLSLTLFIRNVFKNLWSCMTEVYVFMLSLPSFVTAINNTSVLADIQLESAPSTVIDYSYKAVL